MRTSPLFRALLSFRLLTFFAMSLLIENRGGVDKISRYVSRSDVEEAIGGLAVDISPGQIFRKKVSLPILPTYRLILSTASHSRERTNKVRSGISSAMLSDWSWTTSAAGTADFDCYATVTRK